MKDTSEGSRNTIDNLRAAGNWLDDAMGEVIRLNEVIYEMQAFLSAKDNEISSLSKQIDTKEFGWDKLGRVMIGTTMYTRAEIESVFKEWRDGKEKINSMDKERNEHIETKSVLYSEKKSLEVQLEIADKVIEKQSEEIAKFMGSWHPQHVPQFETYKEKAEYWEKVYLEVRRQCGISQHPFVSMGGLD